MSESEDLAQLPPTHPLRTAPLIRIGAREKLHGTQRWIAIGATFRIAPACFNDLGPAWTATAVWAGRITDGIA